MLIALPSSMTIMLCCSASGAPPLTFRAGSGRSTDRAWGSERRRIARTVPTRAVPDGQNSVGLPTQPPAFHRVEDELESRLKAHRLSRWRKVEDCFVLFPPGDEPAAIVHFVGGAFVGAAPQLTYSVFLEELAAKGAVVVATPYHTGFDHTRIADDVHFRFQRALKALGRRVADLPIYGLGHSLGSTIHLLLASRYVVTSSGNMLLSYNNNSVAHTIPLLASLLSPGSQVLGPLFVQLASSSLQSNVLQSFVTHLRDQSPDVIQQISPLVTQLLGIYSEILRGARQFVPTAVEARHMVREGYCVERNLLVQFEADPVDDTEQLAEVLSSGELAGLAEVQRVVLPGNHLRPLQPQLARIVPTGWAEMARTQGDALISRLLDAAGISGDTRGGLERLARAATDFAGAIGETLTGSNGDSSKTQKEHDDGAATVNGADISDLIDECALYMGLEELNHDEENQEEVSDM